MRTPIILTAMLMPIAGAQAMPVATFLQKAEALKAKGPMALFSGDMKLLKNEVTGAAGQLKAERVAAAKAGRKPAYCPPANSGNMSSDQIIAIMRAVPPAERPRTEVKDALRAHFARTWPCR